MNALEKAKRLLSYLKNDPILFEAYKKGLIQIVWRNGKPYVRTTPVRRETDLWKLTKLALASFNIAFRGLKGKVRVGDREIPISAYFTKLFYRRIYYKLKKILGYEKEEYIINPKVYKKIIEKLKRY